MANQYLHQFDPKTSPVGADEMYINDSSASYIEKRVTITQYIASQAIATVSGTPTSGNLLLAGASNTLTDSGIAVDGSKNVTGINTLTLSGAITGSTQAATKAYADLKLAIAANLSDLNSASSARTNLGLGTAAVKAASGAGSTVASVTGTFTTGHVATFADTSGTIQDGGSSSQFFLVSNNLSEGTASTMRTNLGLGTAALKTASGSGSTVASVTGAFTVGHAAVFADTSGTIQDGGSTSGFLLKSNNLSDVANKISSFNNISPISLKGSIITSDGTNNVSFPVGPDDYVLTARASAGSGLIWLPQASGGFVDNAVFISTAGQLVNSITPTPINLADLSQSVPGNTWNTYGDGTGMVCGNTGYYSFSASVPIYYNNVGGGGTIYIQFSRNGTVFAQRQAINILPPVASQSIQLMTLFVITGCTAGDVIRLCAAYGGGDGAYAIADPNTTLAVTAVSIVQLA